jgi:acyl dehydratase
MAIATKETPVGAQLPSLLKIIKLENLRLFTMWTNRNMHTDWDIAKKSGLPAPIAQGLMSHAYISEMCTQFFGENWLKSGKIDVRFVNYTVPGDRIIVGGVVREKLVEGEAVRLECDVWCQNQTHAKTCVGTASCLI